MSHTANQVFADLPPGTPPDERLVDVFLRKASDYFESDFRQAFRLAGDADLMSQVLGYRKGIAGSKLLLARCYLRLSDYPMVLETSLAAIENYRATGDRRGEADGLNMLGWVYNYLGDHENRLQSNLRCLELRRETGDTNGEIGSMNNVGDTYIKLGQHEKALSYFHQCLAHPKLSDRSRSIILHNIGEVHFYRGEYSQAQEHFRLGLAQAQQTNYLGIISIANVFLAEILIDTGNDGEALAHLEEAHKIAVANDFKDDLCRIHKNLSLVYEHMGKIDLAFRHYKFFHETKDELYGEGNIQRIKNIQFEHEAGILKKEAEAERDRNLHLQLAYEQIELQKNEITDSIRYAKRLQEAMLPPRALFERYLPDSFVIYKPKDIVSGDFYWFERWGEKLLLAAVDCTGHGVPGAFMGIVGYNLLHRAVHEHGLDKPALILNDLNKGLSKLLHQSEPQETDVKDGMDVALISIDRKTMQLELAGAMHPLYLVRKGELQVIETDRFSIGGQVEQRQFRSHAIALQPGDCLYLFTDGFADQFGGPAEKKFKHQRLRRLLTDVQHLPMKEQGKKIEEAFENWRGEVEQVDDVCVIGVRV